MEYTWGYDISRKRNPDLYAYCDNITANVTKLRNTTLFLERNLMTGFKKDPASRYALEQEAIDTVMTGLKRHNDKVLKAREDFLKSKDYAALSDDEAEDAKKHFFDNHKIYDYPTEKKWFISKEAMTTVLQETENPDYYALPGQTNQRAVKKTTDSMKAFFSSIKKWSHNKSGFLGKPKLPEYIKSAKSTASFSNQICIIKKDESGKQYLQFPKTKAVLNLGHTKYPGKLQSVEIVPYYGSFRINITFKDNTVSEEPEAKFNRCYSLDPGVRHFITATGNFNMQPFSIDGEFLKDWNKLFCKRYGEMKSAAMQGKANVKGSRVKTTKRMMLVSRKHDRRMNDGMYKIANCLCRKAVADKVDTIIYGHIRFWKNKSDLDNKDANREFVQLPHSRFFRILRCVAAKYGIAVVEQEESYTSQANFLKNDYMPTYGVDDDKCNFSGIRENEFYYSNDGIVIDSDVNGSANILRKCRPDAFKGLNPKDWLLKPVERIKRNSIYRTIKDKNGSSVLPVSGSPA